MSIVFFSVNGAGTGDGGGSVTGANNGTSLAGTVVQLGGDPLLHNSDIPTGANTLTLNGATAPATGQKAVFYGDSVTLDAAVPLAQRWATLICTYYGWVQINNGVSGATLEKRIPVNPFGSTNMIDEIPTIPVKDATYSKIFLMWGVNDWLYGGVNYNPANFKADYITVINSIIAQGWAATDIVMTTTTYVNPALYGTVGAGGGVITLAGKQDFNAQCVAVAALYPGIILVEVDDYITNRGGIINLNPLPDEKHPNVRGSFLYANDILQEIAFNKVYTGGQAFVVNGISQFSDIVYKTTYITPDDVGAPIGIDSAGTIGQLANLPLNFPVNIPIFQQGAVQAGAEVPAAVFANTDFLFAQGTKLFSTSTGFAGALANYIEIAVGDGSMLFSANFVNSRYHFLTGGNQAFMVDRDRCVQVGSFADNVGSTGRIPGDYCVVQELGETGLYARLGNDGSYGKYIPIDVAGNTNVRNAFHGGAVMFSVTDGTTPGVVSNAWAANNGNGTPVAGAHAYSLESLKTGAGIILKDSTGARWLVTVSTLGVLTVVAA